MAARASGPARTSRRVIRESCSSSSAAGTDAVGQAPSRRPARPVRCSPVSSSPSARWRPTRRGSRCEPPPPGIWPKLAWWSPDPRVLGDEREVTGLHQLEAAGQRVALDDRDHDGRDPGDRRPGHRRRPGRASSRPPCGPVRSAATSPRSPPAEKLPPAPRMTIAVVVEPRSAQRAAEPLGQLDRDGVHLLGPVERDAADAVGPLDHDGRLGGRLGAHAADPNPAVTAPVRPDCRWPIWRCYSPSDRLYTRPDRHHAPRDRRLRRLPSHAPASAPGPGRCLRRVGRQGRPGRRVVRRGHHHDGRRGRPRARSRRGGIARRRSCSPPSSPAYLDKTNATAIHAALDLGHDGLRCRRGRLGPLGHRPRCAPPRPQRGPGGARPTSARAARARPTSAQSGDAAAAFLFGPEADALAVKVGEASATAEFLDRWRAPGERSQQGLGGALRARDLHAADRDATARALGAGRGRGAATTSSSPRRTPAPAAAAAKAARRRARPRTGARLRGRRRRRHAGWPPRSTAPSPGRRSSLVTAADGCDATVLQATDRHRRRPPGRERRSPSWRAAATCATPPT